MAVGVGGAAVGGTVGAAVGLEFRGTVALAIEANKMKLHKNLEQKLSDEIRDRLYLLGRRVGLYGLLWRRVVWPLKRRLEQIK